MRHAYLILAHHEFALLQMLVSALDDERNDIYIHVDAKVGSLPQLKVQEAGLVLIEDRRDIRWGDISIAQAEYALLQSALSSGVEYSYLHLLSGVDLPLKSQDYIHEFFQRHAGKEFVGYYQGANLEEDIDRKVRRVHLFARDFKGSGMRGLVHRVIRAVALRVQMLVGYRRNSQIEFKKGGQWFSITAAFARYLLERRDKILPLYERSFCCDEIFVQTELWHSPFAENIFDRLDEAHGCMRYIGWANNELKDFSPADLPRLKESEALFARKFNSKYPDFLKEIITFE